MIIEREWLEELIFRGETARRFTQDSPVLPDVWLRFAEKLSESKLARLDLLLTPHRDASAAELCHALRQRLEADRQSKIWKAWHHDPRQVATEMAYHQSSVVAKLTFPELIRIGLPLSEWWRGVAPRPGTDIAKQLANKTTRERVKRELGRLTVDPRQSKIMRGPPARRHSETAGGSADLPVASELLWMIRVVGTMLVAIDADEPAPGVDRKTRFFDISLDFSALIDRFATIFRDLPPQSPHAPTLLFAVSQNRRVTPTISRSVMAIKGDAARRLFDIDTRNIAWAIVDSGVDATHPAFRKRDTTTGKPYKKAFEQKDGHWQNNTTISASFDFSGIRLLLDPDATPDERHSRAPAAKNRPKTKKGARARGGSAADAMPPHLDEATLRERAAALTERLASGRAIDWDELTPLFTIPHDAGYPAPEFDHGTHVAGILAGDWHKKDWGDAYPADTHDDLVGVCPGLTLFDLRVLNDRGTGDEFTVMAALQFIRHLNSHRDQSAIHGANLSLSLKHDVANYACGRTPVCDECERVVSSGVVVVAAAGNDGYMRFTIPGGETDGYRSISISDPGNAEAVITVGATHRHAPHTYGVSYFSSRGPTGDGRYKPDLVAPGEKITAPITEDRAGTKDGTSMAAPHVSGAAVLLMARNRELLGNPSRVKEILCSTATDLGRERYFQGAGMIDILRALQSV
jgi:serine protease AprX